MSLSKRLQEVPGRNGAAPVGHRSLDELRQKVHRELIEELGPVLYDRRLSEKELRARVQQELRSRLAAVRGPLSTADKNVLVRDVTDDVLGYGPIDPYLRDPEVSEVMVNGPDQVYVERTGRLERSPAAFVY